MTEKVKVSKEVAEAIKTLSENHSKDHILYLIANDKERILRRFDMYAVDYLKKNTSPLQLARILINGYEVEQTPEEKLQALYKDCKYSHDSDDETFAKGIKTALNILGIKINGVNA